MDQETRAEQVARMALGATLVGAGVTHLTVARREFRAQVPDWVTEISPFSKDDVVLLSGAAEIALGTALATFPGERRNTGLAAAAFFTAIFPGNIAQYTEGRDGFGLDTDGKRLARLFSRLQESSGSGVTASAGGVNVLQRNAS